MTAPLSNPLALAVLSCLSERPMHPYEISTTLRTRGKEESIKLNYGSLYSVVESLRKHGLIRPVETSRQGRRPERTVYEITEAGAAEHDDWLAELLSTPVREYTSLEAGLSLMAGLAPEEVARLLEERADRLRFELRGLDATHEAVLESGLPELFLVEDKYRRDAARRGARVRRRAGRRSIRTRRAAGHRRLAQPAPDARPPRRGRRRRCSEESSRPVLEHRPGGTPEPDPDPRRTRTIGDPAPDQQGVV